MTVPGRTVKEKREEERKRETRIRSTEKEREKGKEKEKEEGKTEFNSIKIIHFENCVDLFNYNT